MNCIKYRNSILSILGFSSLTVFFSAAIFLETSAGK